MASPITENLKARIPWFLKIPAKIALSRLPISDKQWQKLNIFRAGTMDSPEFAFSIFKKHYEGSGLTTLKDCAVLELGPGNGLLTALYARSFGATRTWLIDAGTLASIDVRLFVEAERVLSTFNLPVPHIGRAPSLEIALGQLNTTYLTEGLASLQTVRDETIDFMFSNAVLEHVRLSEFAKTVREMQRVLKPNGVASHQIDFRDHLQNGLNNLRFRERIWESEFMASSGFYTNRLNWPTMEKLFRDAGFSVELRSFDIWPKGLPTRQRSMALPFKNMLADELMVMEAHAVLRHRRNTKEDQA
jgi:SAM-dependent methyltransferase